MAKKEFTIQELVELLNQHQVDGKLSFNSLGEIIFDSKFPDTLFSNAKDQIIKAREDEQRSSRNNSSFSLSSPFSRTYSTWSVLMPKSLL